MPRGQEKFVAIADLQGWGYANCDIPGYLAALSILQVFLLSSISNNNIPFIANLQIIIEIYNCSLNFKCYG